MAELRGDAANRGDPEVDDGRTVNLAQGGMYLGGAQAFDVADAASGEPSKAGAVRVGFLAQCKGIERGAAGAVR